MTVLFLADKIASVLREDRLCAIEYAMYHDIEELITGDLPSSAKDSGAVTVNHTVLVGQLWNQRIPTPQPHSELIKKIVKLADLLEMIVFMQYEYGLGNDMLADIQDSHENKAWAVYQEIRLLNLRKAEEEYAC